ncbi:hypothetical protein Ae168Ps1_2761 [Pseudonocardia sp. Ae168_Ps1]|nr:hypothetical protein Ae150APs1_2752 [Pseudonocardia sp. Ae150A_Ps1]OLL80355.1 hypothetical protein Ae168Ps1_2761 [Pseudonocardia sp. Ae168_Ps1]OLL85519.1 hypothetical protein Ae263Ps1_2574c [Pseudonocardia sp. Ae263_Ps1]OLL94454.1 hypothetical protein Ae356Ps1_4351 [Pseudonocardia sp. Ae356_Ps1]
MRSMTGEAPLDRFDVRSRDPEFAHEVIREAYFDHEVRFLGSTEDFEFAHTGVVAPQFMTVRFEYAMAARLRSGASPQDLVIDTVATGRLALSDGPDVLRVSPGEPVLMPTDGAGWDFEMAAVQVDAVVLDRTTVERAAESLFEVDGPGPVFPSRTAASPESARYWNGVVAHVRDAILADDEVASSPLVLAEAARSLATAALVAFPNSARTRFDDRARDGWSGPAVLRRALDYVDEHAGEDIGVADIARAARIGVRGLQHLFRRHRGRTPLEELRRVRLARAHADLLAADPTYGDTVGAIAARWGFGHAGRFSVEYRKVLGRAPSETLRDRPRTAQRDRPG